MRIPEIIDTHTMPPLRESNTLRSTTWAFIFGYVALAVSITAFGGYCLLEGIKHTRHAVAIEQEAFSSFRTANGGLAR